MLSDALDGMLIAILSVISTACDVGSLRLTDRIIARDAQRQIEQLIDDDVARARERATR